MLKLMKIIEDIENRLKSYIFKCGHTRWSRRCVQRAYYSCVAHEFFVENTTNIDEYIKYQNIVDGGHTTAIITDYIPRYKIIQTEGCLNAVESIIIMGI